MVGGGDTAMEDALVLARTSEVSRWHEGKLRLCNERRLRSAKYLSMVTSRRGVAEARPRRGRTCDDVLLTRQSAGGGDASLAAGRGAARGYVSSRAEAIPAWRWGEAEPEATPAWRRGRAEPEATPIRRLGEA